MEIDCTGTIFAKYFGKMFDQISFGCPTASKKNPNRRLIKEYNRKPAKYRKSLNDVVRDTKARVSVSYNNLVHNNNHTSAPKFPEPTLDEVETNPDGNSLDMTASPNPESSTFDICKTGLYFLGAGVGAVGLGALAVVGLCAVGGAACSVFLVERLLCVDHEYQQELKALEVPNVYRPDINNVLYEYRNPYRY